MGTEEGDVQPTGASGDGGDEVDTRGEVGLGVEARHLPGTLADILPCS